eukprot:scaffold9861_cov75-Cyclotella_meneghiniana.AAC.2
MGDKLRRSVSSTVRSMARRCSRLDRRSARLMASSEVWLRRTGVDMLLVRRQSGRRLLLELDGSRPLSRPFV